MSDDRKRFMFDALADELYSLGEVARASPPRQPAPPISIRIVEGQAPAPEPLTLGDFKAAVDTLATASIPTSRGWQRVIRRRRRALKARRGW